MAANSDQTTKKIGFIFMGGSYNPVHSQHIQVLVVIKNYFEKNHNMKIMGGYLVVTADGYVLNKLKTEAMAFEHRAKLCELACNDNDLNWIHPSKYQCGSAINYLKDNFVNQYPSALMINCMGADKILKGKKKNIGKWRNYSKRLKNRQCLTVCINRKGYYDNAYKMYLNDLKKGLIDKNAFLFINANVKSVSSTLIRNVLTNYRNDIKLQNDNNNNADNIDNDNKNDDIDIDNKRIIYKQQLKEYLNNDCVDYLLNNINTIWYKKWYLRT